MKKPERAKRERSHDIHQGEDEYLSGRRAANGPAVRRPSWSAMTMAAKSIDISIFASRDAPDGHGQSAFQFQKTLLPFCRDGDAEAEHAGSHHAKNGETHEDEDRRLWGPCRYPRRIAALRTAGREPAGKARKGPANAGARSMRSDSYLASMA